jgi:hypothetical protein
MNTLQNVYDRLSDKTELTKHEVELNAIDELRKGAGKIGGQILSLESDILANADKIKKLSSEYLPIIIKFKDYEIKAKELGVDTLMNQSKEAVAYYQEKIKRADKYLTTITALTKLTF